MITAIVTRSNTFAARLEAAKVRAAQRMGVGITAVADHLLVESRKLVPVDTTILWKSGRVRPTGTLFNLRVIVGYGATDIPVQTGYSRREGRIISRKPSDYAIYVHEDPTKKHDPPTQYKYLQTPLNNKSALRRVLLAAIFGGAAPPPVSVPTPGPVPTPIVASGASLTVSTPSTELAGGPEDMILREFQSLLHGKYAEERMVPIHEIRTIVDAKYGAQAPSREEFNRTLKEMRFNERVGLVTISDLSTATPQQLKNSVPGDNETFFAVRSAQEHSGKYPSGGEP